MFSVAIEALLVMVIPPVTAPLVCGAKATLKLVLWPAARVSGRVIPLRLNPAPVAEACEMVTLEPPELVKVSVEVWLLLT
jgi:hypothetical protein